MLEESLVDAGDDLVVATNAGYHAAFLLGIGFLAVAWLISAFVLRATAAPAHAPEPAEAATEPA